MPQDNQRPNWGASHRQEHTHIRDFTGRNQHFSDRPKCAFLRFLFPQSISTIGFPQDSDSSEKLSPPVFDYREFRAVPYSH